METLNSLSLNEQLQKANDLLNRQSAELAVRIEAERRQRKVAEGLQGILSVLNSDQALDKILDYIVGLAAQLLDSDACAVYTLDPLPGQKKGFRPDHLFVRAATGFHADYPPVSPIPLGDGVIGQSVELNVTMTIVDTDWYGQIPDPAKETSKDKTDAPSDPFQSQFQDGYRAILAVPLKIAGEIRGCIVLYYLYPMEISDEAIALAMSFGAQVTLALENARQRQETQRLAILEERSRLARELHDSVTQSLYSLNLFAEAGRILARQEASAKTEHYLTRIGETTRQALKEMRLLVYELRPSALEHEDLIAAVQRRLSAVESRAGVNNRLVMRKEVNLPAAVEPDLYRIIQEALNNTLKHARATNVVVGIDEIFQDSDTDTAQPGTRCVEITVSDDGQGFDLGSLDESGGMGIESMRERTKGLGGLFDIVSAPGQGTTIRIRIQLDPKPS